jgi:hypothetical protein
MRPLHPESGMEAWGREGRDEAQKTAPFAERKNAKGCGIRLRDETASARQARRF